MVKRYFKGYLAEWQLTHKLSEMGYMVVRTPRSGRINLASPDVIAAKDGRLIVIECKSRKSGFSVSAEQLNDLREWEVKARAVAYIGWKVSRKGWFFLKLNDVIENRGNVGKKFLEEKSIGIDEL
jgi:Holliday junction resolvase